MVVCWERRDSHAPDANQDRKNAPQTRRRRPFMRANASETSFKTGGLRRGGLHNRAMSVTSGTGGAADLRSDDFTASEENPVPVFPLYGAAQASNRIRINSALAASAVAGVKVSVLHQNKKKETKIGAICYDQIHPPVARFCSPPSSPRSSAGLHYSRSFTVSP